jgi:hypothetical protein
MLAARFHEPGMYGSRRLAQFASALATITSGQAIEVTIEP